MPRAQRMHGPEGQGRGSFKVAEKEWTGGDGSVGFLFH